MRKKVISATFAVALAMVAGYGIYNAQNKVVLSDSAKANVEALASDETDKEYKYHTYPCPGLSRNECVYSPDSDRPACHSSTSCYD